MHLPSASNVNSLVGTVPVVDQDLGRLGGACIAVPPCDYASTPELRVVWMGNDVSLLERGDDLDWPVHRHRRLLAPQLVLLRSSSLRKSLLRCLQTPWARSSASSEPSLLHPVSEALEAAMTLTVVLRRVLLMVSRVVCTVNLLVVVDVGGMPS